MPLVNFKMPEIEESIVRPMAIDVSRQLFSIVGIPVDTPIVFTGALEEAKQPGSEMNVDKNKSILSMEQDRWVHLKVRESDADGAIITQSVHRAEYLPFFLDKALGVSLKPIYEGKTLDLEYEARFKDETSAKAWRADMKIRLGQGRLISLVTGTYHYMFPGIGLYILRRIWEAREAKGGYGQTFEEYIESHSLNTMTKITTQNGKPGHWAFPERQGRIQGLFETDDGPEEGTPGPDGAYWSINFTFRVSYQKPSAVAMAYPIIVHNQPLPSDVRPKESDYKLENTQRYYSFSGEFMTYFENNSPQKNPNAFHGYMIPPNDEFAPLRTIPKTMKVFSGMTLLDDDNDRSNVDLKDLGIIAFTPRMLEFMRGEAPFMNKLYKSIFQVVLYSGDNILDFPSVNVSSDLIVTAAQPQSVRKLYRVWFALVQDLHMLDKDAIERLRENGDVFKDIVDIIRPGITTPDYPRIVDGYIPPEDMDSIATLIDKMPGVLTPMKTVETFFIQALRK